MDFKEFNERIREQEYGTNDMVLSEAFPALMRKVYLWMTLALAISGIVAYGVATSPNLLYLIYTNQLVFWGLIITELVLVWKISGSIWKENRSLAATTLMFATFAALNGATLSYIFIRFAPTAIIKTFFITQELSLLLLHTATSPRKILSSGGSFLFSGVRRTYHCIGGQHIPQEQHARLHHQYCRRVTLCRFDHLGQPEYQASISNCTRHERDFTEDCTVWRT